MKLYVVTGGITCEGDTICGIYDDVVAANEAGEREEALHLWDFVDVNSYEINRSYSARANMEV